MANSDSTKQTSDRGHESYSDDHKAQRVIEAPIAGNPAVFEDTNFVVGDSPADLDFNTALGRNSVSGFIMNDGTGNILVAFSHNGTDFSTDQKVKQDEKLAWSAISIDTVRVTHSGTDSAYRSSGI